MLDMEREVNESAKEWLWLHMISFVGVESCRTSEIAGSCESNLEDEK